MMPRIIVSGTRMARVRPSTITILKPSRIVLPLVVVRTTRCPPPAAARWRDGEVAVKPRDSAAAVAVAVAVDLELDLDLDLPGPLRSGGAGGQDPQGAAQGCAAFSAEAGCLLGKSRRLREPGATHRARRRGVLSLRQLSLHKQRKVARAVTARKLLILISAKPKQKAGQDAPTGCGEEQVGGVAPTYGDRAARRRRACRGVVPIMADHAARREERVGGVAPTTADRVARCRGRVGGVDPTYGRRTLVPRETLLLGSVQ